MNDRQRPDGGSATGESELDTLRLVRDQISEAVIRTDTDFKIIEWSSTAERMYGYTAGEAVGARFTEIVETSYEHTDYDTVLACFRENGHWHGEAIQRGKSGKALRVLASVTLLHDAAGQPIGVVAINRDMTEAYERNAALRESELRFRQFAENSRDVFWMSDLREPSMLFVSDGYERIWGRSCESLHQDPTSFMAGVHPEDRSRVQAALGRQLEGQATSEEYRVVRPDGAIRWVHDQGFPIRGNDGRIERVAGVARDVTELRLAGRRRRALEARVQQMQRLESLGVLAGGIAHDYNNLLTGIMGNLDLALLRLDQPQVVREHISQALLGTYTAAELTKQLVLYAGRSRGPTDTTSWNALAGEMGPLLEKHAGGELRLELRLSPEAGPIQLDDKRARVLLLNLVTNAAEAIGHRAGTVVVETSAVDVDPAEVQRQRPDLPSRAGRFTCLVVSDDGCGIAEADLDRVFDPFYSTKFEGRGLGLASVYGIVQEGGGWVTVASQPGQGSTFAVYLPEKSTSDAGAVTHSAAEPGRPRVLVADDELLVRQILVQLLTRIGYDVETARDGKELLALYEANSADVELLLLDVNMPVLSGLEALERIRERDRSLPVLLCTGGTDGRVATVVRDDPHCALLEKPFTFADMERSIQELKAGSRRSD